jgi:hypothetical protein
MSIPVQRLVDGYARAMATGGALVALSYLVLDLGWLSQPVASLVMLLAVFILRASPVRLSKYSYLTQSGIAVLVGAVAVGPAPVVLALWLGVFSSDVVWLRKLPRAGFINAGREVIALAAAFGPYAAVLALTGRPTCRSTCCPRPPSWCACTSSPPGSCSTSPCSCATSWSTPRRS